MRFWNSPEPTIAALHGACLAGAFELAMSCDITIASEDAMFGEPELSPDKRAFMDIARERGMCDAIAWRDAMFAKAQE